jgi:hypothetical protein
MEEPHFSPVGAQTDLPVAAPDGTPCIQFSAPMVRLLAIVLSIGLWTGLGWSLWWFFHHS